MENNVTELITALRVGQILNNKELSKQAIIELAKIFGLHVEVFNIETATNSTIEREIRDGNKIAAIKALRELCPTHLGLKEAKEEIDRRFENRWR